MGHDGGSVSHDTVFLVEFGVLVGSSRDLNWNQTLSQKSSATPSVVEGLAQISRLLIEHLVIPFGAVDGVHAQGLGDLSVVLLGKPFLQSLLVKVGGFWVSQVEGSSVLQSLLDAR